MTTTRSAYEASADNISEEATPLSEVPNLWVLLEARGYAGRVRDGEGKPLNGFAVKNFKKTCKVSTLFNGHYSRHYRFPTDVIAPKHPMVRWFNVPMCGLTMQDAYGNSLADGEAIAAAVLEGKKPVGDISFKRTDATRKAALISRARAAGLEVLEYTRPHNEESHCFVMLGVNKSLAGLFNLTMVSCFYQEGTGWAERYFSEYLEKVKHLTPAQALQTYDWASPLDARELMLTGLCLGYAFESTLAIILEHYGDQHPGIAIAAETKSEKD